MPGIKEAGGIVVELNARAVPVDHEILRVDTRNLAVSEEYVSNLMTTTRRDRPEPRSEEESPDIPTIVVHPPTEDEGVH